MRKQSPVVLAVALIGCVGWPAALPAQNLDMPASTPATTAAAGVPARGQTMGSVEKQFGAPAERYPAVGRPPITRWVYPGFVVFFEYDHVVHAVAVRK
jgi:hypothetical protein